MGKDFNLLISIMVSYTQRFIHLSMKQLMR